MDLLTLAILRRLAPCTAKDLADHLRIPLRTAQHRLRRLADAGLATHGPRYTAWTLTPHGHHALAHLLDTTPPNCATPLRDGATTCATAQNVARPRKPLRPDKTTQPTDNQQLTLFSDWHAACNNTVTVTVPVTVSNNLSNTNTNGDSNGYGNGNGDPEKIYSHPAIAPLANTPIPPSKPLLGPIWDALDKRTIETPRLIATWYRRAIASPMPPPTQPTAAGLALTITHCYYATRAPKHRRPHNPIGYLVWALTHHRHDHVLHLLPHGARYTQLILPDILQCTDEPN
jgi:DNA-binding MarR family transcriptional regulator